jgi:S-adenosylmethionine decarboxylase
MQGLHLVADLAGCATDAPAMTDADVLRTLCEAAVRDAGLTAVAALFHRFSPTASEAGAPPGDGVTGVVLLAESHLAVHTWPELGVVTVDVHVCNRGRDNRAAAAAVLEAVIAAFRPARVTRQALERAGKDTAVAPGTADGGAG